MALNFVGHLLALEGAQKTLDTIIQLFSKAKDTGDGINDFISGKAGGKGINDEFLALDACQEAMRMGVDRVEIVRISELLRREFTLAQRSRIIRIICAKESEITISEPVLDDQGNPRVDKKGNPIYKTKKQKGNLRGAELIVMFSKMSDAEIVTVLTAWGATTTTADRVRAFYESVRNSPEAQAVLVRAVQLRTDYEATLARTRPLRGIAKRVDIFGITR